MRELILKQIEKYLLRQLTEEEKQLILKMVDYMDLNKSH